MADKKQQRWRGESELIRLPSRHKQTLVAIAEALDAGAISGEALMAIIAALPTPTNTMPQTTETTETKPKAKRHWVSNPTGKGLPYAKKWNSPTASIRLPERFKEAIVALAQKLDSGAISVESLEAFMRGENPPPPSPPLGLTTDQLQTLENWSVKPVTIDTAMNSDMPWVIHAPGVRLGYEYFKIEWDEFWKWLNSRPDFPQPPQDEDGEEEDEDEDEPDYQPHYGVEPGDARLTIAHSLLGQPQTLKGVEEGAIALTDLVLARPKDDRQVALAKELNEALTTLKRGRAAAVVSLARKLSKVVLGWEE